MHNIVLPSSLIPLVLLTATIGYASPVLEGRTVDGAASQTCTVSGPDKCAAYYYRPLDFTVLNEAVSGFWSSTSVNGSAQETAATIGYTSTGLAEWVLPSLSEYATLFFDLGASDWQSHFGSYVPYWANADHELNPSYTWTFDLTTGSVFYKAQFSGRTFSALAIRQGDMPTTVPEPTTLVLAGLALLGLALVRSRA